MNSCHCSGKALRTNEQFLVVPLEMSTLPFWTVIMMALSEPAALTPKVAGAVMALVVAKALSSPSLLAALFALGRAEESAEGKSDQAWACVPLLAPFILLVSPLVLEAVVF